MIRLCGTVELFSGTSIVGRSLSQTPMMYMLNDTAFDQEGTPWVSQIDMPRIEATRTLPLAKQRRDDGVEEADARFPAGEGPVSSQAFQG